MPEAPAPAAPQLGATAPSGQSVQVSATPAIDPQEFARFKGEFERLSPLEQQFKNGTKFHQTASKYGLKDEDSLNQWGQVIQKASGKGFDAQKLAAIFDDPKAPEPQNPLTREAMLELLDKRDSDRSLKDAKAAAEKELQAELELISESKIRGVVGEKADPKLVEALRLMGIGHHLTNRQVYPDGHPLAGQLGVAGKDYAKSFESFLREGLTAAQAHKLAKLGDAALKPAISTPAGSQNPGGAPAKPATKGMSRDQLLASATERAKQGLGLAS